MKTTLPVILALVFTLSAFSESREEQSFKVYNPSDSNPKEQASSLRPEIYESVKLLIEHLKSPKDQSFIVSDDAYKNLQWRLESLTILSPDIVAAHFTEGHIGVYGIFQRDEKRKRWELKSEFNGIFRERLFDDPTPESED